MSQNIALLIAFGIVCALFLLTSKLKVRNKLSKLFYDWFKNMPSSWLHVFAFFINFGIILGVGIGNSILQQIWFTLTILPIGIVIALNITTSLIAVARTVKYESMHGKIKPRHEGRPRPKAKNKK
ncbi:MAG: hypothetical protein ACRCWM_10710 [Sarcina sp.]